MRLRDVWVPTFTGKKFFPFYPNPDDICIRDIAHSLSNQCRYNGNCIAFYSVAGHSVELSNRVPECDALWGLLHDAAEAYLGDVIRPYKLFLTFVLPWTDERGRVIHGMLRVEEAEEKLLKVIAERFGLDWPMPATVVEGDTRMVATERMQLFDPKTPEWLEIAGVEPYPGILPCWQPHVAERRFLDRFEELTGVVR